MYLGKRNIFDSEKNEQIRDLVIADKSGATWNAFVELEDLINKSQISQQYFEKSASWFSQRLHGCTVRNKAVSFKEEEYHQIAEAFRDIAKRLVAHADEIDNAKMED